MRSLSYLLLCILHLLYSVSSKWSHYWRQITKQIHASSSLSTPRRKTPKHLAIAFVLDSTSEDAPNMLRESAERAIYWCGEAGISRLTLFDKSGNLQEYFSKSRACALSTEYAVSWTEAGIKRRLFPSLSNCARSGCPSPLNSPKEPLLNVYTLELKGPVVKHNRKGGKNAIMRKSGNKKRVPSTAPLTLHVISSHSAHTALASAAQTLSYQRSRDKFTITTAELAEVLEGPNGFPSPDLLIVQHLCDAIDSVPPLELHGFPSWQMRLTEIHHSPKPIFDQTVLCDALDEYSGAEMRLGR